MSIEKFEKKIAEYGKFTLTDKRIFYESKMKTEEIPIRKIDTISHEIKRYTWIAITGVAISVLSLLFSFQPTQQYNGIWLTGMIFGILLLALAFFYQKECVEVRSNTLTLSMAARGSEDFIKKLREIVYNKGK